jgi:hypothetical protein
VCRRSRGPPDIQSTGETPALTTGLYDRRDDQVSLDEVERLLIWAVISTRNLRAVQLLLGHTKLESTVRYLGIEVDDALEISGQTEV